MNDSINERIARLLPSQKLFLYSPETERVDMGGWRAGKSRVLCTGGMLLSYLIPDNFGFIGRASGKDLHSTTVQTFFDEVCPPDLIVGKPRKIGQSGLEVVLKTRYPGATSKIYFDYIVDKQSGKSHLAGGNWGWFGVDQLEEIQRGDWHKLMGRLSRTYFDPVTKRRLPIKTHALGVGNQMGHDWIFEDFFEGGDYTFDLKRTPNVFFKQVKREHRLGVIVRSEENMMSNGGFVPDEYYSNLRRTMPPHWCARYMDGSFDDFSGKIVGDFNPSSVHVIEPFKVPSHWPWYCAIDPGGSAPWGIVVMRVDEAGNKLVTSCADEIYNKTRLNPNEAVRWIKDNLPITKTRFIIDYQNIPVMQMFQDEGIHCEPAMKDIKVGLDQLMAEFWVNPRTSLPIWYEGSQGKERYLALKDKGAPKVYVFDSEKAAKKELDNYLWDPEKKNVPKKGQADHVCDGIRYLLASSLEPATGMIVDPYKDFRGSDPTSAVHLDSVQRELRRLQAKDAATRALHADPDGGVASGESLQHGFIQEFGGGYY